MADVIDLSVRSNAAPYVTRLRRSHELVNIASTELRVDGQGGGEAVAFFALAVAVHLKCALGPEAGRAAMQRAIDYAFSPEQA